MLYQLFQLAKEGYKCVWEISEGDIKFLYATKPMPPKDLGSIVHLDTNHWKDYL